MNLRLKDDVGVEVIGELIWSVYINCLMRHISHLSGSQTI